MESEIKTVCNRLKIESATEEIDLAQRRLEFVIRCKLRDVDPVLAGQVEIVVQMLEYVQNSLRDGYGVE